MEGSVVRSLLVIWILSAVVCGSFAGGVAGQKGYAKGVWFWSGVFFGPLALIAAAGLPDKRIWSLALYKLVGKDIPPIELGLLAMPRVNLQYFLERKFGPTSPASEEVKPNRPSDPWPVRKAAEEAALRKQIDSRTEG